MLLSDELKSSTIGNIRSGYCDTRPLEEDRERREREREGERERERERRREEREGERKEGGREEWSERRGEKSYKLIVCSHTSVKNFYNFLLFHIFTK